MAKRERTIGLWLDDVDGNPPKWIVSEDIQEAGETTSSTTLAVFEENEYEVARANALGVGRRNGLAVIETPQTEGPSKCIYSPAI